MGNFTTVPDVVVNQSFPPSLWESAIMNNLNLGVCRQLADTTVAGASVANVTFASIPATFAHLMLVVSARDTSGNLSDDLLLQFNGDTAGNYDNALNGSAAQTTMFVGFLAGGTASANRFAGTLIFIPDYANTVTDKVVIVPTAGGWLGASNIGSIFGVGNWRSTAAINQILLKSASGNIDVNSRVTLYGFPE